MRAARLLADPIEELVAILGALPGLEPFERGQEPPPFPFELGVEPGRLALAESQLARDAQRQLPLLAGAEPRGHALPQDQPLGLVLDLLGKGEPRPIHLAQLRDAPFVECAAEARTDAESREVQPADFVRRTLVAPGDRLEQGVGERADD